MKRRTLARVGVASLLIVASSFTGSTIAADPPIVIELPAGLGCAFALRIEISLNPKRVEKTFQDKNGNVVRMIFAGKGNALAFTNVDNGAMISLRANGSAEHVALHPDGTQTWTVTGHNVLVLFPSDIPAGPSTTLYEGRVVFTVDTSAVFTLQSTRGRSTDLCAALSA